MMVIFFFQAEDGIRDDLVTGVQTCALPILLLRCPSLRIFRDEVVSSAKDIGCEVRPQLDNDREIGRASCRERV